MVAHLQLDEEAAPGEPPRQAEVAAEAGLPVRPEEAVEAQDERTPGRAQAVERGVRAGGALGHGDGRPAAGLAGLHERANAEAQRRPGPRVEAVGPHVGGAGERLRGGRREERQGEGGGCDGERRHQRARHDTPARLR